MSSRSRRAWSPPARPASRSAATYGARPIPPSSSPACTRPCTARRSNSSDGLPLRLVGEAGPLDDLLARALRVAVELLLVDRRQPIVVHHLAAVDEHRVHAAAVGRVHELV